MNNTEIKVGDYVNVTDGGHLFDRYDEWASKHNLSNFVTSRSDGVRPKGTLKVVAIGEHLSMKSYGTLLGLQDENGYQFIVGTYGVRKIESAQTPKTISKESFLSLVRQDIGQEEESDVYVDIQKFLLIPTVEYVHLTKYDEFDIFYNNREYSGKGLERLYEVMNNIISLEN